MRRRLLYGRRDARVLLPGLRALLRRGGLHRLWGRRGRDVCQQLLFLHGQAAGLRGRDVRRRGDGVRLSAGLLLSLWGWLLHRR